MTSVPSKWWLFSSKWEFPWIIKRISKLTIAELFKNLYAYWPCYVKSIFLFKSAIYTLEIYLLPEMDGGD
jgi:hypothetical protein